MALNFKPMKFFRVFWILYLSITTLLMACIKTVEFTPPEHKPALVLNSIFNPDSIFTVDLTSSRDIFSNEDFSHVKNTSLRLFSDGKNVTD